MVRPCDLRVIMRVQIDEAGRDDKAACIDLFGTSCGNLADLDDAIARDGDIGDDGRTTRSVDNGAVADHHARILTHGLPSSLTDLVARFRCAMSWLQSR